MTELRERVIAGRVKPVTPGTYSPELVGLMHGLLTLTPARRPTLTAILTMPQVGRSTCFEFDPTATDCTCLMR